eukprot:8635184-Ditylum_brightwellii.AAC.1
MAPPWLPLEIGHSSWNGCFTSSWCQIFFIIVATYVLLCEIINVAISSKYSLRSWAAWDWAVFGEPCALVGREEISAA